MDNLQYIYIYIYISLGKSKKLLKKSIIFFFSYKKFLKILHKPILGHPLTPQKKKKKKKL